MRLLSLTIFSVLILAGFMLGMPELAWAAEAAQEAATVAPAWTLTAATVLATIMQVLKSPITGALLSKVKPWMQPVLIAFIGQIAAFIEVLSSGVDWKTAAIQWLFVSGGAMAIYDTVIKPIFKKQ